MLIGIFINIISIFLGVYLINNNYIYNSEGYTMELFHVLSISVVLLVLCFLRYLLNSKDTILWRSFDLLIFVLTSLLFMVLFFFMYYSFLLDSDLFKTNFNIFGITIEKLNLNHDARHEFINQCWNRYYSNVVDFVYLKYGDRISNMSIPSTLLDSVNKMDNKIDVEKTIFSYCEQLKINSVRDNYWYRITEYSSNPLFMIILFLICGVLFFKLGVDLDTLFKDYTDFKHNTSGEIQVLNEKKDEIIDELNVFTKDFSDDVSALSKRFDRKIGDVKDMNNRIIPMLEDLYSKFFSEKK